jgi:hypothetical protein
LEVKLLSTDLTSWISSIFMTNVYRALAVPGLSVVYWIPE